VNLVEVPHTLVIAREQVILDDDWQSLNSVGVNHGVVVPYVVPLRSHPLPAIQTHDKGTGSSIEARHKDWIDGYSLRRLWVIQKLLF